MTALLASCLIYAPKWALAILLIADAHFGARFGAFFYCTGFFLNNVPFNNTTPIYLINLLWKLGLGLWLDSELHYFSTVHGE